MACLFGHKWNGCKCSKCGKIRDKGHNWNNCKCETCGTVTFKHKFVTVKGGNGIRCEVCGYTENFWAFTNLLFSGYNLHANVKFLPNVDKKISIEPLSDMERLLLSICIEECSTHADYKGVFKNKRYSEITESLQNGTEVSVKRGDFGIFISDISWVCRKIYADKSLITRELKRKFKDRLNDCDKTTANELLYKLDQIGIANELFFIDTHLREQTGVKRGRFAVKKSKVQPDSV